MRGGPKADRRRLVKRKLSRQAEAKLEQNSFKKRSQKEKSWTYRCKKWSKEKSKVF